MGQKFSTKRKISIIINIWALKAFYWIFAKKHFIFISPRWHYSLAAILFISVFNSTKLITNGTRLQCVSHFAPCESQAFVAPKAKWAKHPNHIYCPSSWRYSPLMVCIEIIALLYVLLWWQSNKFSLDLEFSTIRFITFMRLHLCTIAQCASCNTIHVWEKKF